MVRALIATLFIALSTPAAAQPNTESTQLFEEGRALAKDGKYEEACRKFEKSLALDRASGTLVNLADCHEHLGHLALAWRLFDEAARESQSSGNADRAKFARERAQALVIKTSTVVVKLAQPDAPGLSVKIGDRDAPPAPEVREVVDPGDVTVLVTAANGQTFTKTERAEAGLKIVIEVPALSGEGGGSVPTQRRRSRVLAAYTLGGFGAVSLVTGVVIGITAKGRYDREFEMDPTSGTANCTETASAPQCNPDGYTNLNNAITLAKVGTVFGAGGVLLLGAGAVVFLTAPRDVIVIPTASAGSGGLAVVGRF
jgi:tetratricopeptide (TPR) repeat protein